MLFIYHTTVTCTLTCNSACHQCHKIWKFYSFHISVRYHHFQVLSQRPTRTAEIVRECVKVTNCCRDLIVRNSREGNLRHSVVFMFWPCVKHDYNGCEISS